MDIFLAIVAVLSLIVCVIVIVDKTVFERRLKEIKVGMTGKEVQDACGYKINPETITVHKERNSYEAILKSYLTIFKYRLIFYDGKLVTKQRI